MLHFKKLFQKPKVKPSDTTEMIDTTPINYQKDWINDDLTQMLKDERFNEYHKFMAKNWKSLSEGAHAIFKDDDTMSVERFVHDKYYATVIYVLLYGYRTYTDTYDVEFRPFGNEDMFLLVSLALERDDFSRGIINDIVRQGKEEDSDVYFVMSLVPFFERFDRFWEMYILNGDNRRIELMNVFYECKNKISVLHPHRNDEIPSVQELVISDGYQKFIDMNKELILEMKDMLDNRDLACPMELDELIPEMYDMLVIDHLLRVADYNKIIHLTSQDRLSYAVEMLTICLPMNLYWLPDDKKEKEILDEFKKRVTNMAVKKVNREFTDGILNEVFGEKRKCVAAIEDTLIELITKNGVLINNSIENSSTREKAIPAIKEEIIQVLDDNQIGPRAIHDRYINCYVFFLDPVIEATDDWDLVLEISLPVYEKSEHISDPDELRKLLVGYIEKYKEKKLYTNQNDEDSDELNDWDPIEKEWDEFRGTGLFLIVNQFLHIFGWALCYNTETKQVKPARVRYRGFSEGSVTRAYEKVQRYMIDNAQEIYEESDYENRDE